MAASGVSFSSKTDNVGVTEFGLIKSTTATYNSTSTVALSAGTFYGYVKDAAGNTGSCSRIIAATTSSKQVSSYKAYDKCSEGAQKQGSYCYNCCSGCAAPASGKTCAQSYGSGCVSNSNGKCIRYHGSISECDGSGWTKANGRCEKYTTVYNCASGYTKIDNSWCYK